MLQGHSSTTTLGGDWDQYLDRIEKSSPPVEAIGVTDYFCINTYREMLKYKSRGRLPSVALLFPNVEMRLDLRTDKSRPLNIHLLFSPEAKDHIDEIDRILSQLKFEFMGKKYDCSLDGFQSLGKAFDPKQTDPRGSREAGANQYKVNIQQLKDLFRGEVWLQRNCLIAVPGSDVDGTSGLKADSSFTATRREIETFADVIFSASEKQRAFWLGKSEGSSPQEIEKKYRSLKPCIHGSDAHEHARVACPDMDRFCWIKGDLTFESLRQVVLEPDDRVWIGSELPSQGNAAMHIAEIHAYDAPWFSTEHIPLNSGLVAVIGARGSGKTALVDLVAASAGVFDLSRDSSSFLERAGGLLGEAIVEATWGDGSKRKKTLGQDGRGDFEEPYEEVAEETGRGDVCYLSQHFVEKLCSASELAKELKRQIERVIFESMDPTEHMETDSFERLHESLMSPIGERMRNLQQSIKSIAQKIVEEDDLKRRLPRIKRDDEGLQARIAVAKKGLLSLVPKGEEERAKRLAALEEAESKTEARIETLRRRKSRLEDLLKLVEQITNVSEQQRLEKMKNDFEDVGLSETEWKAFHMVFTGDPQGIVTRAIREVGRQITFLSDGEPSNRTTEKDAPLATWPLKKIAEDVKKHQAAVSIDSEQRRKYHEAQTEIKRNETSLRRLQTERQRAEGAEERRGKLIEARRKHYVQVFGTFVEEETVLNRLYEPLRIVLSGSGGSLGKLTFEVRRSVDLDSWVKRGEALIDLRTSSRFRGHGSLRKLAKEYLLEAWESGTAATVSEAMESFRNDCQRDLMSARPPSISSPEAVPQWSQNLADWLYSTDHITLEYGIQYDSVSIEQLSPGTRGIVLLLLYLAIDVSDRRPLIIDQPEENLDPNSVFTELVPHFREARKRRQVIVVTHNANLVVNTDAEQVIVAKATQSPEGGLPNLTYQSGSLENPEIRGLVCELLEGGERAFLEREKRYRLKWASGMLA